MRCARRWRRWADGSERAGASPAAVSRSDRRPRSRTSLIRRLPVSTVRSSTSTPPIPTPSSLPCCRCSRRSGIRRRGPTGPHSASTTATRRWPRWSWRWCRPSAPVSPSPSTRPTSPGGRASRRSTGSPRPSSPANGHRTPGCSIRSTNTRTSPPRSRQRFASRAASSRSPEPRRTSSGHGPTERSGSSRRGRSPRRDPTTTATGSTRRTPTPT